MSNLFIDGKFMFIDNEFSRINSLTTRSEIIFAAARP